MESHRYFFMQYRLGLIKTEDHYKKFSTKVVTILPQRGMTCQWWKMFTAVEKTLMLKANGILGVYNHMQTSENQGGHGDYKTNLTTALQ